MRINLPLYLDVVSMGSENHKSRNGDIYRK